MSIIFNLRKTGTKNDVPGECANCNKEVYESLFTLDDCYNVWAGRCPLCNAVNFLSMQHGLRGYSSSRMHLVLPTQEEAEANDLPKEIPLGPSTGEPATTHGSPLGEFLHKLREPSNKKNPE